ncbi:MAG: polyphosphate kinase 2, partial [Alphaproteobacteria bacterium]|nr:polyphosphate kinase 2 [Alphaproteobacteria bacterium]
MARPDLPLVGAISRYLNDQAPEALRQELARGKKREILDASFPYDCMMDKAAYEAAMEGLQLQLVQMMHDIIATGKR